MLPLLLSHELAHPFKFWYDGQIQEGMCSNRELYRLAAKFSDKDKERQQAFSLAIDLAEQGGKVCITCTQHEYCVWISLRSRSVQQQQLVA